MKVSKSDLKSIIKECIMRVVNEMAYPAAFSMDEFKSLSSYAKRIQYCNEKLQRLSSGSSRIVYKIDDEKVLKLAKNAKGLAQNEVESNNQYISDIGLGAKVYDSDDNNLWIEMQLARPARKSDFKRLTGFDFKVICDFVDYFKTRYSRQRYHFRSNEHKALFDSEEFQAQYDDYDSIFCKLQDYMGNYRIEAVGDLQRISSWGVVSENGCEELVLIDYGLSDEVFSNYYRR